MANSEARSSDHPQLLFDTIAERRLSDDDCFLCGEVLTNGNRTKEHVVPKWAQERFELWDQEFVLLNGTSIPYRFLVIPCCRNCNNKHLQPLEAAMAEASKEGPRAVLSLGEQRIYAWLAKIFYGVLHKELFLQFNRKDATEGTIYTEQAIRQFQMHHYMLQSVRLPMVFTPAIPASIFVFECQSPLEPKLQWDFRDSLTTSFISVRMGTVGIYAALQDGRALRLLQEELAEDVKVCLHPLQHQEVAAKVYYKLALLNRVPKFMITEGEPINVVQLPIAGLSTKPIFDDWDWGNYARVLSQFTGCPFEKIHPVPGKAWTWLKNSKGEPNDISFEMIPWQTGAAD